MPVRPRPFSRPVWVFALPLALAVAACGGSTSGSGSTVAVTAGDSACQVARTTFDPGKVVFSVRNAGSDVTEVYVYGKGDGGRFDKVVGEVENVAPGTSREFPVKFTGGDYDVTCKPGQRGDGIRTRVTVGGAGS